MGRRAACPRLDLRRSSQGCQNPPRSATSGSCSVFERPLPASFRVPTSIEDLMRPQQRASSLTMRRAGDGYSANTVLETFPWRNSSLPPRVSWNQSDTSPSDRLTAG